MKVLSIEAGGAHFSLACVEANEREIDVRATYFSPEARSLSRDLVSEIDAALTRAAWTFETLEVVAVGIGPGSWTSLRIALSTAKTLAQIGECQLCGVPTFAAFSHAAELTGNCLLLSTARCRPDEFYGQLFYIEYSNGEKSARPIALESVASAAVFAAQIRGLNRDDLPVFVCGETSQKIADEMQEIASTFSIESIGLDAEKIAVAVAQLGAQKIERGKSDDLLTLQPLYIGVSNAERVLAERVIAERNAAHSTAMQLSVHANKYGCL